MQDEVNLAEKLADFHEYFGPKIVGELNAELAPGELFVLLIEPIGTPNTGDVGGELTATEVRT